MTINSKVVAITGASSGIGEATARHLASLGAAVVLGARRTDRLDRLVAEIQAAGGEAAATRVDVTHPDDLFSRSSPSPSSASAVWTSWWAMPGLAGSAPLPTWTSRAGRRWST